MTKRTRRAPLTPAPADRSFEQIAAVVRANAADRTRGTFDGLRSSEIAAYNRRLMFGEGDAAFPSAEEWRSIVD